MTGIEPRGGSELRLSLLKICEWREREKSLQERKVIENRKQDNILNFSSLTGFPLLPYCLTIGRKFKQGSKFYVLHDRKKGRMEVALLPVSASERKTWKKPEK